jgi:FkbM family methyltransferase
VPNEKVTFVHKLPAEFVEYARRTGPANPVICDIGSRDALDGIYLYKALHAAECHIFEPNPTAIEICKSNIAKYGDGCTIFFSPVGLSDTVGTDDFFPVNLEKSVYKDMGFSSMLPLNPVFASKPRRMIVQDRITITTTTLDSYFAKREKQPDVLWMDVEGAELRVFSGGVKVLEHVRLIHVEVSFRPMQIAKPLFWEIDEFLKRRQFRFFKFIGVSHLRGVLVMHKLLPNSPWRWNAVYYR